MKRVLCFIIVFAFLATVFQGCSNTEPAKANAGDNPAATEPSVDTEPAAPDETGSPAGQPDTEGKLVVDLVGREVLITGALVSLAPGDDEARFAMYALSPEIKLDYLEGEAQATVYMGEGMDAEALDKIQEEKGVPVIGLYAGYDALTGAYLTLGSILGMEQEAEEIANYLEASFNALTEMASEIPADDRARVYYGTTPDGLVAGSSDSIALAGALNIAEASEKISLSELKTRGVNQVVFGKGSAYDAAEKDWSELEAISMCLYYEAPDEDFDWMQSPFAPDNVFASKWLANLLYPDRFPFDAVEETRMYYDLFRHRQLSVEEAEAMLAKSSLKTVG